MLTGSAFDRKAPPLLRTQSEPNIRRRNLDIMLDP
jgi:hypothetical protein